MNVRRAKAWLRPFSEAWCPTLACAPYFERMPRKVRKALRRMDARQRAAMAFLLESPELFDPDEHQPCVVPGPARIPRRSRNPFALPARVRAQAPEAARSEPVPAAPEVEPWDDLFPEDGVTVTQRPEPAPALPPPEALPPVRPGLILRA